MIFCDEVAFDFTSSCVRSVWATAIPTILVFVYLLYFLAYYIGPPPLFLRHVLAFVIPYFTPFMSLEEAESYNVPHESLIQNFDAKQTTVTSFSYKLIVLFTSAFEIITLLIFGALQTKPDGQLEWQAWRYFLATIPWLYIAFRCSLKRTDRYLPDIMLLSFIQIAGSILEIGGMFYQVYVAFSPLPSTLLIGHTLNLVSNLLVFGATACLPVGIPGCSVDKAKIGHEISPEDYTPIWKWLTWQWINPQIRKGASGTLQEKDVWELSPIYQSRPLFSKFSILKNKSLVGRLWRANSFDIIVDFCLTSSSITLNYASPFFLKRILEAIDSEAPTREQVLQAYVFACLAFSANIVKALTDVQRAWLTRRASIRIQSELMANIYEKTLKRRAFNTVPDMKDEGESSNKASAEKKEKGGAGAGKVVQLMSADVTNVSQLLNGLYFFYCAPLDLFLAMTFLFRLLGVSAFIGAAVLVLLLPLHYVLLRTLVRFQKSLFPARDARMGLLNEFIGSIKFIKYCSWERNWIERIEKARKRELRWLTKTGIGEIILAGIWSIGSPLVAVVSFTAYVMMGHELTVPTAFTAIILFRMLGKAFNITHWLMMILRAKVSAERIDEFLQEPEVDDQMSSLKKAQGQQPPSLDSDQSLPFGIEKCSFRWNSTEESTVPNEIDEVHYKAGTNSISATRNTVASSRNEARFELQDINIIFPEGKLTVITGPTASGKTALFVRDCLLTDSIQMALLGEMSILPGSRGRLLVNKDSSKLTSYGFGQYISYAAQLPWIQHLSIRDNILFGLPLDVKRYEDVLECCALKPDLAILEDGDLTEIGVRGVTLSGGQKARVALARAVYAPTQYVLLDDPLRAVDSHTARFLYERLLTGPLLANRTVVLITHHIDLVLPGMYYLVHMRDGRISLQGVAEDLRTSGQIDQVIRDVVLHGEAVGEQKSPQTVDSSQEGKPEPRKLVQDELRAEGRVKLAIYGKYLKASSYWTWAGLFFLIALIQGGVVAEKWWIKQWGDAYKDTETLLYGPQAYNASIASTEQRIVFGRFPGHERVSELFTVKRQPLFYVAVYAALSVGTAIITVTASGVRLAGSLRASRLLFKQLLEAVTFATFRFHDTNPTGRLLNRFSKDVEIIDKNVAENLHSTNISLASCLASIVVISVVLPKFLILAPVIAYCYVKLAIIYIRPVRDLKRMESIARSPIFSNFSELLDGIITVRAFSAERRFLDSLFLRIDLPTKMWMIYWNINRWVAIHFDFLSALSIILISLIAISGRIPAGYAGLTITSAMVIDFNTYWACRYWTQLELDLNSVERVVEYLSLPQEPPAILESKRPPAYWPSHSSGNDMLVVKNLVVRYSPELPSVLHGVSFSLKAGERVGVLGRTGSGKSTLATSIMRFVDPSEGSILVDGIEISQIGLHDLRSRITFIPQDATLFFGTVRDNLDPFDEFTDSECWNALYTVGIVTPSSSSSSSPSSSTPSPPGLSAHTVGADDHHDDLASTISIIPSHPGDEERVTVRLDTAVSAGGANFSQGQRQLLALGRAFLRQSTIIIMDEATSSIDFETDLKIQAAIRKEFKNSLLITVAHRLKTVADYDRLLVLDQGRLAEFDTPYNLIRKQDGLFRMMCLHSGMYEELEEAARLRAGE